MEKAKKEAEKLLDKYQKDWNKYGMGSVSSNSAIVFDLQELVKLFAIPDVVHQREQFKSMVFDMANKLAIAGYGDEAMSMYRIYNRL